MIFFTSDLHFWHANVIKYCNRPYASVEEMNEKLILNWNSVVSPKDTVYVLGDFSLAIRPVETFTHRLNGIKYLVSGNHDWGHSYNKKSRGEGKQQKWIDKYTSHGWIVLPEQTTLEIPGVAIVNMCHLPYSNVGDVRPEDIENPEEPYKDKYLPYRPKDDGRWLLCGHVHEKFKIKNRMINVGVDVWGMKPVSIEEIKEIILNEKVV